MAEIILIVDDEEPVRKTFREWLDEAGLGAEIVAAADAETALNIANQRTIDLAILDWNLGAGDNGLQLLEDLAHFNPDVVAIMVTGYAHQTTPLHAMRMGVRDYFDKNQDLNRESFLVSVQRQLEKIRPVKRERQLQKSLAEFRDSVEKILPLVRTTAAMNDPVPFTESVRSLFRFLMGTTGASDGALLVRSYDADCVPAEIVRAYDIDGKPAEAELVPFSQSLAGAVIAMQQPSVLTNLSQVPATMGVQLQPFEQNRQSLLAAPLTVGPGLHVVLELFDKPGSFSDADRRLMGTAAEFGAEMIKHALAERQFHSTLFDAVSAALEISKNVSETFERKDAAVTDQEPAARAATVMEKLRQSLDSSPLAILEADQSLRLAELIRVIAAHYGRDVTQHCIELLENVNRLLRAAGEGRP